MVHCQGMSSKTTAKKTAVGKSAISQVKSEVIFNNKKLHPVITMYFLSVNKTGRYLANFCCLLSKLFARDNHDGASYSYSSL